MTSLPLRARLLSVVLPWLVLACAGTGESRFVYVNETMGIASAFGDEWAVYTDRASAPKIVEHWFPEDKGPDESPLLLAIREGGDASGRVWVDPVPRSWNAVQYFEYLYRSFKAQADVYEVSKTPDGSVVRWMYRDRSAELDLTYMETLTVREGFGIRFGFWTYSANVALYREEFEALSDAWHFRDEAGDWKASWTGLSRRLSNEGFAHVALTEPGRDEAGCVAGTRQLLYEVRGDEGSMFLFGSVHLGQPSHYPLPNEIEAAFKQAKGLIVEMDITSLEIQREIAERMQFMGELPPGETIREHIEPGALRRLEAAYAALGIPLRSFETLKPWAHAVMLSAIKIQSLGYLPRYGVDRYFLDRAGARTIVSLETPEDQLGLFDELDGELFLAFTLLGLENAKQEATDIMRAWRCGDEALLEELLIAGHARELPGAGKVVDALFYERNERMAAAAARRLEGGGNDFMVVGVGHLVGERGVPALLRARGFEVFER